MPKGNEAFHDAGLTCNAKNQQKPRENAFIDPPQKPSPPLGFSSFTKDAEDTAAQLSDKADK